jgi:hypothetical protein
MVGFGLEIIQPQMDEMDADSEEIGFFPAGSRHVSNT